MKKIVEMHFCDVCGCEVNTENRYIMRLDTLSNWNYDANIDATHEKDLCPDCYNTILQLIGEVKRVDKLAASIEKPKCSTRIKHLDKEEIKKMWAYGISNTEIAKRLGASPSTISYHISKWSEEEKDAIRKKYINKTHHNLEETKQMKVIMDEYGFVQSIEEES